MSRVDAHHCKTIAVSLAAHKKVTHLTVSTVVKPTVISQAVETNTVRMHALSSVGSKEYVRYATVVHFCTPQIDECLHASCSY